jgi:hypothetical protein
VPERDDDLHTDDVRKILADLDEKAAKRPPPTAEELEAARAEYDAAMTAVHEAAERARRVKPFSLPAEAKITPKVIIVGDERAETGEQRADLQRRMDAAWPKQKTALFAWGTIKRAVQLFRDGQTHGYVVKKTKLEPKQVTRVRRMWEPLQLLRLNNEDELVPDWRVRTKGNRIALRYWDMQAERWVDPLYPRR